MSRRIVVIGGGIGGAGAARHLASLGEEVVLLERGPHLGGLVVSFEVAGTPLECFYHHVFPHEGEIVKLIGELGLGSRLDWFPSSVGMLMGDREWPFTSPLDLLRFGALPFPDRVRTGLGALRMGRGHDWKSLDRISAREWLASLTGDRALNRVWDPLLRSRFGQAYEQVPAAWMWGRFRQRAGGRKRGKELLGYLRGGFRQMFDALERDLTARGADVRFGADVRAVVLDGDRVAGVEVGGETIECGAVLYTGTLPGLPRLVPPEAHEPRWSEIGALGVLCVVLELARPLAKAYWTNVVDDTVPFGGVIEHTNLVPPEDYAGCRVVYVSRYHTLDEAVATVDPREEADRWIDVLEGRFPGFRRDDVLGVHPFRTPYAAPLPALGMLERIPPVRSHLPGLFLSTTAQIYPEDRGMDEGLRRAVAAADLLRAEPA